MNARSARAPSGFLAFFSTPAYSICLKHSLLIDAVVLSPSAEGPAKVSVVPVNGGAVAVVGGAF